MTYLFCGMESLLAELNKPLLVRQAYINTHQCEREWAAWAWVYFDKPFLMGASVNETVTWRMAVFKNHEWERKRIIIIYIMKAWSVNVAVVQFL